ncbi:hypothetical protein [Mucilaginibacter terrae]|uniref:Uncharacterized protein n=1 Tax=Mucilaginibacter terrae TaxID=1955052 RepID=A0ABU3GYY0_9SPHI|nr:hypothetical protein [Mucilaginibacter terrae]MDT3404646.1 hypothetical protein [Mucilaginibacter terrae]
MTTLTIEIPDKSTKTIIELISQLGGKVVTDGIEVKKQQVLDDIEEAVVFIKDYKAGKVKAQDINQLLDEL